MGNIARRGWAWSLLKAQIFVSITSSHTVHTSITYSVLQCGLYTAGYVLSNVVYAVMCNLVT